MKKTKDRGITLVALIVTVVILLILSGISIANLTGNGLFEKAKLAKEKQDNSQKLENLIFENYKNEIEQLGSSAREDNYQYQKLRSDNYEEVPFVSGGKYIAPCDGYYCAGFSIAKNTSGWCCYVRHYLSDGTLISQSSGTSYNYGNGGCELYLKKDEYITFYNQYSSIISSKFFYAEGCQPETTE